MTQYTTPVLNKGFGFNETITALFTVATIVIAGVLSLVQLGVAFI